MVRTLFAATVLVGLIAAAPVLAAQTKSPRPAAAKPEVVGTVNINTASATELERPPGIGPKTAGRIIGMHGRKTADSRKIEELMNVRGVGEKNFLVAYPDHGQRGQARARRHPALEKKPDLWSAHRRCARRRTPCAFHTRAVAASGSGGLILWRGRRRLWLHADRADVRAGAELTLGAMQRRNCLRRWKMSGRRGSAALATKLQQARMEAIVRAADVGWQFVVTEGGYTYTRMDGNGNGIRTRDIRGGIDRPIGAAERLTSHFAGVDFGVYPACRRSMAVVRCRKPIQSSSA
jgi:hypothetical protein